MARLLDLKKRLANHSEAASALAQLTEFTTLVTLGTTVSGGVLTLPIIVSQAGKTASSLSKLVNLFLPEHDTETTLDLDPAERADDVFYVFAQRAFTASISELAHKLTLRTRVNKDMHTSIVRHVEAAVVTPDRAEASFHFGWSPSAGPLQLFESYKSWLGALLVAMGGKEGAVAEWLNEVEQLARKNLFRELVARDKAREWMVHYQLLSNTTTILDVLKGFSPTGTPSGAIWKKYLSTLVERPLLSIWGEETQGVSIAQLFVEPDYEYSRYSMNGSCLSGNPAKEIPLRKFLLGLLSGRRPSTELVFVMGGPGTGKTSLMDVFCAELAGSGGVPVILIPAKRLSLDGGLFLEIQEYLRGMGFGSIAESLPTTPNMVLVIDGFDELAHATLSTLESFFRSAQELVRDHASLGIRILLSGRPTLFAANDVTIPAGSHVVTLRAFNGPKVAEWSKNWRTAANGSFDGTVYLGSDSSDLRELASQPMLLYLLARMHEDAQPIPSIFGTAHGVRSHIYARILDWVCKRQEDKKVPNSLNVPLRRFMQIAGLATHQSGQRTLHWNQFSRALEAAGLAEDPKEADAKAYATILSFAFTNIKGRAWEFTHKSFGEALASEAIGRVLEDIAEKGRDGEPWRLSLPSATKLWIDTFGPHFLTKDILDFCTGWITTRGGQFSNRLVPRLTEVYHNLCGPSAAAYVHEVSKACEIATHAVIGNSMRSWFALTNATLSVLADRFPSDLEKIEPTIEFEQLRAGVYLSNLVSPISLGEAENLFKWTSRLVIGRDALPSRSYIRSLTEAGLLLKAYKNALRSKSTAFRPTSFYLANLSMHDVALRYELLSDNPRDLTRSKRATPLEQALNDADATLQVGFEQNAIEEMFELAGISTAERMTTERVQKLEKTLEKMVTKLGENSDGVTLNSYFHMAFEYLKPSRDLR